MGDRVVTNLQTVPNVVFIYTTAGDGNNGATYWQYRERAAQTAMDAVIGAGAWTCANRCRRSWAASRYPHCPIRYLWLGRRDRPCVHLTILAADSGCLSRRRATSCLCSREFIRPVLSRR